MVLGLGDVLTHETGVQRVLKSVKGDALPLPDNPSDSVNEGRLTQTLEAKDLESPMSGRIVWNRKNGGAREDRIVSGRVWTRGGEPKRGKLVLSLSHPPSSFSAPVVVTSSSQILGMMKNEECGMDEFLKMADKCSDKDKDKDLSSDKTGPRTRSSQTDRIQTARMPSIRDRVLQALRDIQRDKHGSTTKDKTVSGERTLESTENSKASNDCVAQGTSRVKGQSFTDGQESRTTEAILPLTTRMDMECQTLLPTTKGNF